MTRIELKDAQTQFPQLLAAALTGEEIIITQDQQPVLKLVSLAAAKPDRKPGSAQGMVWMADDFNDAFEDDGDTLL